MTADGLKRRHKGSEIAVQLLYLLLGLTIAFPIIYAFFISSFM